MNSSFKNLKLCISTITTDSFIPGTLVMLYSFLKHHPWFTGDIIVFIDKLTPENRNCLLHLYDRVRFVKASKDLCDRVDEIKRRLPNYRGKFMSFYTLESFGLRGYDKVLYLDADLLFRGSINELFDLPHPLAVSGDGNNYHGIPNNWYTLNQSGPEAQNTIAFEDTFNAGFMVIDKSLLSDEHRRGLLNLVDSRIYGANETNLTDQIILNMYFSGKQHLVSARYNYVIPHHLAIRRKEGLKPSDAKVLHFIGRTKPWLPDQAIQSSQTDPTFIRLYQFWFESYIECMESLYVKTNTPKL